MARVTLSKTTVRELAFDVACKFFKDPQLCRRYGLSQRQLDGIRKQDAFQREVDEMRFVLQDDGKRFFIKARGYAEDVLEFYHDTVMDGDAPYTARQKAGEKILAIAGVAEKGGRDESGKNGAGGGHLQLILNTNLSLPGADGAYQLKADAIPAPVQGRTIEGQVEQLTDDVADLL